MSHVATAVYKTGAAEFNQVGQLLGYPLTLTDDAISQGLAQRLVRHAEKTLDESGFKQAVADWAVSVSTMDATEQPSQRCHQVTWTNSKGGAISVVGIMTRNGWPTLDYGLTIER